MGTEKMTSKILRLCARICSGLQNAYVSWRSWCYRLSNSLTHVLSVSAHGGHSVLVAAEVNICLSARPAIRTAFNQDL